MADFGEKIKELRKQKNMTLKDLSSASGLSIGFLSQLERNLTTVAVDALQKVAASLGVDLGYFFSVSESKTERAVIRSYERAVAYAEAGHFIHQYLSPNIANHNIFAEIITLIPDENPPEIGVEVFSHEGEEFIYVLEGILTLDYNHEVFKLHHGDTVHMDSKIPHNWYNTTGQMVKILVVRYPNPFEANN
jgi:transcriptional regulator with XRE-family HTH domain